MSFVQKVLPTKIWARCCLLTILVVLIVGYSLNARRYLQLRDGVAEFGGKVELQMVPIGTPNDEEVIFVCCSLPFMIRMATSRPIGILDKSNIDWESTI